MNYIYINQLTFTSCQINQSLGNTERTCCAHADKPNIQGRALQPQICGIPHVKQKRL